MIFYGSNSGNNSYDGYDTIIANDLLNKNLGLFACSHCNCLCLNLEKNTYLCSYPLKDLYIRDKSMVYWYFDSSMDQKYYGSNRFAWIYDPCSSKMDLKLEAWLKSDLSDVDKPSFENFKAYDSRVHIKEHFRDSCTNNVVYLWRLRNFHLLYNLDFGDFSNGNFEINGTHIFYINGIFISVNDKNAEYIDFVWIRVINDEDTYYNVKCFGDFRYYGNYIYDIKNKQLIIPGNFEVPYIFKNYVYQRNFYQ